MPPSKRIVNATCCCGAASAEDCICCDEGTTQLRYAVTFGGVVPLDPVDCEDCPDWNDCWTVDQWDEDDCKWAKLNGPCTTDPDIPSVILWLTCDDNPAWPFVNISVQSFDGPAMPEAAFFLKSILGMGTIDCSEDYGDIPFANANIVAPVCDWTASTCSVAAGPCP